MISTLALVIAMTVTAMQVPLSLPQCPESPNCVSSQAIDSHQIEPFKFTGEARASFDRLHDLLAHRNNTTIISSDDMTIKVEFRTSLGFVDDGLFVLDSINNLIHIRSAARIGYWDMGKNRRRMEEIRQSHKNG